MRFTTTRTRGCAGSARRTTQDSAFYPVTAQIEAAAGFARGDEPSSGAKGTRAARAWRRL